MLSDSRSKTTGKDEDGGPRLSSDPYDAFAWFYDLHWAGLFTRKAAWTVGNLVLPHVPAGGRLLDLCSGTGHLAEELGRRGYHVTCVDRSREMLRLTRARAPLALLLCADARHFSIRGAHDASVSLFDSLNHLLDPESLTLALRNVRSALKPGAPFLFDLNTESGFRERWVEEHEVSTREGVCRLKGVYDRKTRLGHYRIYLEGRGRDCWRRSEFEVFERCHTASEVRAALGEAGFGSIETYDAERDLGLSGETGRVFYLARARSLPRCGSARSPRKRSSTDAGAARGP